MEGENNKTSKAQPEEIPKGTYIPFLLAVSVLFIGWGFLTNPIISIAGTIGFFIALAGWIKEMIYERRNEK